MCTTLEMKVVFSPLMYKLMLLRYIDCLLVYVSKSLMVDFSLFRCVYACGVCVCMYACVCLIVNSKFNDKLILILSAFAHVCVCVHLSPMIQRTSAL